MLPTLHVCVFVVLLLLFAVCSRFYFLLICITLMMVFVC